MTSKKPNITKSEILKLAGTDKDRELIRYSVYKMSGLVQVEHAKSSALIASQQGLL